MKIPGATAKRPTAGSSSPVRRSGKVVGEGRRSRRPSIWVSEVARHQWPPCCRAAAIDKTSLAARESRHSAAGTRISQGCYAASLWTLTFSVMFIAA